MSTTVQDPPGGAVGPGAAGAVDAVGAALAALSSGSLPLFTDEELVGTATVLGRVVSQVQAALARVVGEIDDRELGVRRGGSSTTAWVRHALNMTPREARTLSMVGAATHRAMSAVRAAFAAGNLSLGHAAAIVDSVRELPPDVPVEIADRAERDLVDYSARFDPQQLARLGQHILTVLAPEVGEQRDAERLEREAARARTRRELYLSPDGHGCVVLRGRLTDEAAGVLRAALDPLSAPLPVCADGPDLRTAAQRRADALHELARRALVATRGGPGHADPNTATPGRRGGDGGSPTQLVVTVPLRTLTDGLGYATLPDGNPLGATAARRLACAASLIPAVLGTHGAVLDLGRAQRLFTGARRRALVLRDRGCAFPGCDRPPEWCDAHHILSWLDGGCTDRDNGVLLCEHHHHTVHADGWRIVLARDGTPELIPPRWIDPTQAPQRNHRHPRRC